MENKKLAVVNGIDITQEDLDKLFQSLAPQAQAQFEGEEGKAKLLDELIYQELFYSEAVAEKVDQEPDFIKEMEELKTRLMTQYKIKKMVENVDITEEEMKSFYDQNQQFFSTGHQVKASHILVDDLEKANEIKGKLDDGMSFADAAKEFSKCPSKESGGSLGYFEKGMMVPEFEEAAFSMKNGALSEPVKTQFGYHLIMKEDEKQTEVKSFDQVKDQIAQNLLISKQNEIYLNKIETLKKRFKVEKL